jgi:hypothetical protein
MQTAASLVRLDENQTINSCHITKSFTTEGAEERREYKSTNVKYLGSLVL